MRLRRTTARILLVAAAVVLAAPASAHTPRPNSNAGAPRQIIFPVVGATDFYDDFGAARAQGGHQGNDLLAARHTPVVAAEAGRVQFWTASASAGCMLYLYGRSGTTYLYIHLNDDLGDGNDNRGRCVDGVAYASGLRDGQSVPAGALLGFVGDSGDAEGRHPHLHFELHPRGGAAVSPYRWLRRATHLLYPGSSVAAVAAPLALKLTGTVTGASGQSRDGRLTMAMAVRRVALPGGASVAPGRSVVLAVPASAEIKHAGGSSLVPLSHATAGDPVTVWSTVTEPSLRAEVASPGELSADRVLLADGS